MKPGRTATRRRGSREERRDALAMRLLEGINKLNAEGDTFASASIERLTMAAGVGRSTFYLYFQDKTELLQTWLVPITADLEGLDQVWSRLDEHATSDVLKAVLHDVLEVHRRHPEALPIILAAHAYDPVIRDAFDESVHCLISALSKQIRIGQREGWVQREVLARESAVWLVLMTMRGGAEMLSNRSEDEDGLLDTYAQVMLAGLYGPRFARSPDKS